MFFLLASLAMLANAPAQSVFHKCPMTGDAQGAKDRELNLLKNRFTPPKPSQMDTTVTLERMLAPGDDSSRFVELHGATIEGFVHEVKEGGAESCNCHATDPKYRDTHISLVPDAQHIAPADRVIVEVTPRLRAKMKRNGVDWSTKKLASLIGRRIRVTGWLLLDRDHLDAAVHTAPGNAADWRATGWEIHPVTSMQILN